MAIITGSTAAKYWFPDFPRDPGDTDAFAFAPVGIEGNYDTFWHHDLTQWFDRNETRYATPDELYTIKVSHAYWELKNGSHRKHIFDMLWLKNKGAKFIPELHSILYKIWEKEHGKKKMDLTKEADDFFADAVNRIYDHDSIHRSVAYTPGDPMYEAILKDGHTVDVDPAKMWSLSFQDQVKLFREEIAATALERLIVPNDYRFSPGKAWVWALRRTITSLTKGKSARFIVLNYEEFMKPDDYVKRHLENRDQLILLEKR